MLNVLFIVAQFVWLCPLCSRTIARARADMMDVAWGLCTGFASVVASSTDHHYETGTGSRGTDTNQTSHFLCSSHKYLCGSFINSGAGVAIKGNSNTLKNVSLS